MIRNIIILLFACLMSLPSYATRRYFYPGGITGTTFKDDPVQAVDFACQNAIGAYDANGGSFMRVSPGGTYAFVINSRLESIRLGSQRDVTCQLFSSDNNPVRSVISTITVGVSCTQGLPGRLIKNTTIASFDTDGLVVPSALPGNPQCSDSCIVQHAGGSSPGGISYSNIFYSIEVGTPIWVVYTTGISYSGQTCNYINADQLLVEDADILPPLDQINDMSGQLGSSGGGTGGGSSGGGLTISQDSTLNNIYANTQSAQTKLDSIEGKLDSLLDGTGGNPDGTPDVIDVGTFGIMPQAPIAEAPVGGLVSPSETDLNTFKSTMAAASERAAGTCPTWTFHIAFLGNTSTHGDYKFDQHCALVDSHRGALETVMTVFWSVAALALVLKA